MKVICETCSRFIRYEEPFGLMKIETEPCPNECSQIKYTLHSNKPHQALLPLDFNSWGRYEENQTFKQTPSKV